MFDFATIFLLVRVAIVGFLLWLFYRAVRSGIARVRGDWERAKRLRGHLIWFVIAFVLLWPFTGVRLQKQYLEWRYRPQLYEMAATLGYTEEEYLASGTSCIDPLLTLPQLSTESCRIFLYFTTTLTATELESIVMRFSAPRILHNEETPDLVSALSNILFTKTPSIVSIHNDNILTHSQHIPDLHVYDWIFAEDDYQTIQTIELYETSRISGLRIDDKPMNQDVIRVDVELGSVYFY